MPCALVYSTYSLELVLVQYISLSISCFKPHPFFCARRAANRRASFATFLGLGRRVAGWGVNQVNDLMNMIKEVPIVLALRHIDLGTD
jgi:hypothetical protein